MEVAMRSASSHFLSSIVTLANLDTHKIIVNSIHIDLDSEHPIAQSFVDGCVAQKLSQKELEVERYLKVLSPRTCWHTDALTWN